MRKTVNPSPFLYLAIHVHIGLSSFGYEPLSCFYLWFHYMNMCFICKYPGCWNDKFGWWMKKNSAFHRVLMRLCFCYATFVFVSSSHLYQNKLFHSFYAFWTIFAKIVTCSIEGDSILLEKLSEFISNEKYNDISRIYTYNNIWNITFPTIYSEFVDLQNFLSNVSAVIL